MPSHRHLIFMLLLTGALLTKVVCAQSYTSGSVVEMGAVLGVALFQMNHKQLYLPDLGYEWEQLDEKAPLYRDEVIDEIEWPDEDDEPESKPPILYGHVADLDVLVQGSQAKFKLSDHTTAANLRLSQTMRKFHISHIDSQPGQLNIFPEDPLEPPVSVILPFENEPLMPVTGIDWLDQSEGLAFVRYQNMEVIAAIAEAALSGQPAGRHVGLEAPGAELIQENEPVWFDLEALGEIWYAEELPPEQPQESIRVEVRQESEVTMTTLDFRGESIRLYATENNEGRVLGAFEYLLRKSGGGVGEEGKKESKEETSCDKESGQEDKVEDPPTKEQDGKSQPSVAVTHSPVTPIQGSELKSVSQYSELELNKKREELFAEPSVSLDHKKDEPLAAPDAKRQCMRLEPYSISNEVIPNRALPLRLFCCCSGDQKQCDMILRPDRAFLARGYVIKKNETTH